MKTLFRILDGVTESLGILVTCALIIIASIQVFFRYVLGNALAWPEEVSLMLFLWMAYLGMVMAMKSDSHLRVDAFVMALPPKGRKFMHCVCLAGSVAMCLVIARYSLDTTLKIMSRGQTAIAIDLPIWIVWTGIPLCFLLTSLQAARRLWTTMTEKED